MKRTLIVLTALLGLGSVAAAVKQHNASAIEHKDDHPSYASKPNPAFRAAVERQSMAAGAASRDTSRDTLWYGMDISRTPDHRVLRALSDYDPDTSHIGPDGIKAGHLPTPPSEARSTGVEIRPFDGWGPVFYGRSFSSGMALMLNHEAATEPEALAFGQHVARRLLTRFNVATDMPLAKSSYDGGADSHVLLIKFRRTPDPAGRLLHSPVLEAVMVSVTGRRVFHGVILRAKDVPAPRATSAADAVMATSQPNSSQEH